MSLLLAEKPKTRKIEVTPVYDKTATCDKKVVANVGGAGSSKSYSIAQLLIHKLVNEHNKVIGIGRKTFPALRMTAYRLVKNLLIDYGIYDKGIHNKTEHTFTYQDNLIQFFSLDEPAKIRSAEFNYLWLEEAIEFSYDDFITLKLRLRASTREEEKNQMFLTSNPVDENSWLAKLCGAR